MELRPNKQSFIYYSLAQSLFFLGIFFLIVVGVLAFLAPLFIILAAALFFVIVAFIVYSRFVRYKKTRYFFEKGRLLVHTGSIFSEHEAELVAKNTTQVWMTLPWLEHKLLGTGTILVRAAGSGSDEIMLRHIDNPQGVHEQITLLLQNNGFRLTKKELLQREEPSILGVCFEVAQHFLIGVFVVLFFAGPLVVELLTRYMLLATIGLFIVLFIFFSSLTLRFLDLKNKEYHLYKDTITYRDGFLTQHFSIIPAENLADVKITQNFIDRIFGLYTVVVSSQGSENSITFSNMLHGEDFKKRIEELIDAYDPLVGSEKKKTVATKKVVEKTTTKETPITAMSAQEFKMDLKRTLFGPLILATILLVINILFAFVFFLLGLTQAIAGQVLLFFLLFIILGFMIGSSLVTRFATTYYLTRNGVREQYDFLRKKNTEFSLDKTTMIVIHKNPLDWFLKTCTINFRSIGSSEQIVFRNVEQSIIETIKEGYGVQARVEQTILSDFSFLKFLQKNLFSLIGLFFFVSLVTLVASLFVGVYSLIMPLFVLMLLVLFFVHRIFYYRRSKLFLAKNYLCFERGLVFQEQNYSRYNDLKDVATKQYISSSCGSLTISAAGEIVRQQQSNHSGQVNIPLSNGFTMNYIDSIFEVHDYVDSLLGLRTKDVVLQSPRALANTVLPAGIISVVFWPLIPFLPFIVMRTRTYQYTIESERIRKTFGLFYKQQKTILFDRIDHLNLSQGPINKIYNNATILVYTAGSASAEMRLKATPEHRTFYNTLEEQYKD